MLSVMKKRHLLLWMAVAVALTLLLAGEAHACPNCRDALPSAAADTADGSLAEGFYYSILLLMAAPFVLAATFGGTVWYYMRKPSAF